MWFYVLTILNTTVWTLKFPSILHIIEQFKLVMFINGTCVDNRHEMSLWLIVAVIVFVIVWRNHFDDLIARNEYSFESSRQIWSNFISDTSNHEKSYSIATLQCHWLFKTHYCMLMLFIIMSGLWFRDTCDAIVICPRLLESTAMKFYTCNIHPSIHNRNNAFYQNVQPERLFLTLEFKLSFQCVFIHLAKSNSCVYYISYSWGWTEGRFSILRKSIDSTLLGTRRYYNAVQFVRVL